MNVSGKLIIQGKAWGEFESAKRSKGNIEISKYRSYGGTHTVRMVDQPQLNENQQIVLDWLRNEYTGDADPFGTADCLFSQTLQSEVIVATLELTRVEQAQVLKMFADWALEQEEE